MAGGYPGDEKLPAVEATRGMNDLMLAGGGTETDCPDGRRAKMSAQLREVCMCPPFAGPDETRGVLHRYYWACQALKLLSGGL